MHFYATLADVLADVDSLRWEATLFASKRAWASSPRGAAFLYLVGDDELEDLEERGEGLPRLARENGVDYFLDVQTFKDVILKQRELDAASTLDDFVRALNHYREYDSFYWPRQG